MYQRQGKDTELRQAVAALYRLVTERGALGGTGGDGSGEADVSTDPVGRENQEWARQFMAQQGGVARAEEEEMVREAGERRMEEQMEEMDATLAFGSRSSFEDMGRGGGRTQGGENDASGSGWTLNSELMCFESQSSGGGADGEGGGGAENGGTNGGDGRDAGVRQPVIV